MAPMLIANVLTVTFVNSFASVHQKELAGQEEIRLTVCGFSMMHPGR